MIQKSHAGKPLAGNHALCYINSVCGVIMPFTDRNQ